MDDTNKYTFGKGKPVYVVNGGPGLEYSYLRDFLMPFETEREINYYDQIGTGNDYDMKKCVTADELSEQLIELLSNDKRRKDIIAHSWGTYLVLSALRDRYVNNHIDKVILINPFALDYARYLKSGVRLVERFPQKIIEKIEEYTNINTKESYLNMMYSIAPYYTYNPLKKYDFKFESYNASIEDGVYGSIIGFNQTKMISITKGDIFVIKSDDDFISLEDTKELQENAKEYYIISDCGHFPFVEKKEECYNVLNRFLKL